MAGKAGQILDKIYEAIENGRFSEGARLCQLPDIAKFTLAQALCAYCHASMRKHDYALKLARAVLALQPKEEAVVNALTCTFKQCRAEQDFAACYENILKTPTGCTEHNLSELFFCYARQREHKKMQMTAQRLYKLTENARYLFWSAGSALLQKDLSSMLLVVAEKTLRKVFYELQPNRPPGAEELQLYLCALLRQGKAKEALEEVRALSARENTQPLQDEDHFRENVHLVALQRLFLSNVTIDFLTHLQSYEEVQRECLSLLQTLPDQWAVYTLLQNLLFARLGERAPLSTFSHTPSEALSDLHVLRSHKYFTHTQHLPPSPLSLDILPQHLALPTKAEKVAALSEYVAFLCKQQNEHAKLRGPTLAWTHLLVNLLLTEEGPELWAAVSAEAASLSLPSSLTEAVSAVLQRYVRVFRTKACCCMDLQPLLYALCESESASVRERGRECVRTLCVWLRGERETAESEALRDLTERLALPVSDTAAVSEAVSETVGESKDEDVAKETAAEENDSEDENDESTAAKSTTKSDGKKKKRKNRKKKSASAKQDKAEDDGNNADNAVLRRIDREGVQKALSREEPVLRKICELCQLDMLVVCCESALCDEESETSSSSLNTLTQRRLSVASLSRRFFAEGVGGEKRVTQPADELSLLVASSFLKNTIKLPATDLTHYMKGLSCVSESVQNSVYSHALKIDLLSVCDVLCAGELAWRTYQDLGVKQIQNDSMSYLIGCILSRSGCFAEAVRLNKSVMQTASGASREALDMLSKAFDFGNFNRVLELDCFAEECNGTLQLRTAQTEQPLFELTQLTDTRAAAEYLVSLFSGKLPESIPYQDLSKPLTVADLQTAKVTHDFSLTQRVHTSPSQWRADREARLRALRERVVCSHRLVRFFGCVIAQRSVEETRSCAHALLETLPCGSERESTHTHTHITQRAHTFDQSTTAFDGYASQRNLTSASVRLILYLIEKEENAASTQELVASFLEAVQAVRTSLCEHVVWREAGDSVRVCSPAAIERLSYFLLNHWSTVSLALQTVSPTVTDTEKRAALISALDGWLSLAEALIAAVRAAVSELGESDALSVSASVSVSEGGDDRTAVCGGAAQVRVSHLTSLLSFESLLCARDKTLKETRLTLTK